VHSLVKRGVAIARESHLIVSEESGPRRGFAAHIRCRAHDNYGLDAVVAENGVEVRLEECVILMLYDAILARQGWTALTSRAREGLRPWVLPVT
jgi:hypothetical protein